MKKLLRSFPAFALLLISFISCRKTVSYDMPPSEVSLYEIIKEDSYNFSYFRSIIERAGLTDLLNQKGNYTVLAPTSYSFLSSGFTMTAIQSISIDSLQLIVKNHIVEGNIDIRKIEDNQELTALSGEKILVQKIGDAIYVDGSDITNSKTALATNGTLNVINKLLVKRSSMFERINTYSTTSSTSSLAFLSAAITRASEGTTNFTELLSDPNASYTFFAPNNGAFIDAGYNTVAKINAADPDTLGNILNYHLIQGLKLVPDLDSTPHNSITGVPVHFDRLKPAINTYGYANGIVFGSGTANMMAGKGVIHVVPRFLPTPIALNSMDRIVGDTSLSFFHAALVKAGEAGEMDYIDMLSDPKKSYTVFAVNNDGFRKAGYDSIDVINAETGSVLSRILKFHFVNKRQNSINFAENGLMTTLLIVKDPESGAETPTYLTVTKTGGYKVKGASNTKSMLVNPAEIVTTNGLVNIIDGLLLP